MYVYKRTEDELWTVGYLDHNSKFQPESDHDNQADAAARAAYLNGGPDPAARTAADQLRDKLRELCQLETDGGGAAYVRLAGDDPMDYDEHAAPVLAVTVDDIRRVIDPPGTEWAGWWRGKAAASAATPLAGITPPAGQAPIDYFRELARLARATADHADRMVEALSPTAPPAGTVDGWSREGLEGLADTLLKGLRGLNRAGATVAELAIWATVACKMPVSESAVRAAIKIATARPHTPVRDTPGGVYYLVEPLVEPLDEKVAAALATAGGVGLTASEVLHRLDEADRPAGGVPPVRGALERIGAEHRETVTVGDAGERIETTHYYPNQAHESTGDTTA